MVLNPGQAGVISILGKAKDGVLLEGIHFKPPIVSVVDVYDLTVQKFEVPAQSSTKDLQDLILFLKLLRPKRKNPLRLQPHEERLKKR